jgi:hypothetical protein
MRRGYVCQCLQATAHTGGKYTEGMHRSYTGKHVNNSSVHANMRPATREALTLFTDPTIAPRCSTSLARAATLHSAALLILVLNQVHLAAAAQA